MGDELSAAAATLQIHKTISTHIGVPREQFDFNTVHEFALKNLVLVAISVLVRS